MSAARHFVFEGYARRVVPVEGFHFHQQITVVLKFNRYAAELLRAQTLIIPFRKVRTYGVHFITNAMRGTLFCLTLRFLEAGIHPRETVAHHQNGNRST